MAFVKKRVAANKPAEGFENLDTPLEIIDFAKRNGIYQIPINVAEIASKLDITVNYEPMPDDNSGSLSKHKKTGKWIMTVNSLHHPHRQRFTIAHEIGHRIRHAANCEHFEDTTFFRNGDTNPMEVEANRFAAEILMPEDEFISYLKNKSAKVEDIAEFFHVSSMAVRIRAKQLGYQGHNL
jgi:Zn-dependent peptidase ImmA (M78 family)